MLNWDDFHEDEAPAAEKPATAKPAPQAEARAEAKPETKTEAKPAAKPEPKAEAANSGAKRTHQPSAPPAMPQGAKGKTDA